MADKSTGNTTIGVELELLLLVPWKVCDEYAEDYHLRDTEGVFQHMVHSVLATPIETECQIEGCNEKKHLRHLPLKPFDEAQYDHYGAGEVPHSAPDSGSGKANDEFYSGWNVVIDVSLGLHPDELDDEEYNHCAVGRIEIQSRIMNFRKPTPCPGPRQHHDEEYDWRTEVAYVIDVLDRYFNDPKVPECRLIVNSSCGYHVHVGGQKIDEWPHIARGIMALYTAFERHIDRAIPTTRIAAYDRLPRDVVYIQGVDAGRSYDYPYYHPVESLTDESSRYCRPLSWVHHLGVNRTILQREAAKLSAPDPMDEAQGRFHLRVMVDDPVLPGAMVRHHIPAWLYLIMSSLSIQDLEDLWSNRFVGHQSVVDLSNIVDDPDDEEVSSNKWTIEFRAFAGTLDAKEVIAWAEFQAMMIENCAGHSNSDVADYALQNFAEPNFGLVDLVRDMGCSEETQRFFTDLLSADYAIHRRNKVREREVSYPEGSLMKRVVARVEDRNYSARIQYHVDEKIRRKFEKGLYGRVLTISSSEGLFSNVLTNQPVTDYGNRIHDAIKRNADPVYRSSRSQPRIENDPLRYM